ncbi:MAG: hypothetical protein EKK47_10890 [Burkholderiales bacterium]|nr:MAG: hypothetical protein EKK47_10890 [Burkholderiales bacterium]
MRSEVLKVVEAADALYYMTTDYEEGDIGHGIGCVYRTSGKRTEGEVPVRALLANETLSSLWVSPQGHLWVASANGHVATTARLPWSAAGSGDGAGYDNGPGMKWVVTSLPRVQATGLPPNITVLWGTSDQHVFAGTYGGHIYQWDGQTWRQTYTGAGKGQGTISALGGPGSNDVFAGGQGTTLLHFDGSTWQPVALPGASNGRETFRGIITLPTGEVMISGNGSQGRLLHGTAKGLTELGRYDIALISMAQLDDRILFATGDGCAELIGRDVQMIKDSFQTVDVLPGRGRVFYIEPDQPYPGFVEYDPKEGDDAWWGMEY